MTLNAFLALAAITAVGATQSQPPSLEVGKPVAAEIGGETHVYRVALKAGEAMHVVVNQLGADIVLRILDSNAQRLVEVDSPTGPTGQESAWLVATATGDYAVEVRPFGKNEKGLYGTPNLWLGEFLADYLSIAHAAQDSIRSSGRKFEETGLDWLNEHVKPKFRTLQDFDHLWVQLPPDNYARFHAQFTRRAHAVYRNQGLDFLKRVKAAFPASERGPLPVDEILSRLEKIAPGFVEWAAGLAARK